MNSDKIIIIVPSGIEVEMLSENDYFLKYTSFSRLLLPTPDDYNNWAYFLLKNTSVYESLTNEDKIYIMNEQYKQYKTLWKNEE